MHKSRFCTNLVPRRNNMARFSLTFFSELHVATSNLNSGLAQAKAIFPSG